MKVYISADIEGITGVTHWDETHLDKQEYLAFQEQMTAEVAAACEGAIRAGATEIWVKDAHGSGRNILASRLPQEVRLIRGWSGHPFVMMQQLDKSFSGAVLIGYHSAAGAAGNPLSHTMTTSLFEIAINGQPASEFLINAYTAGLVRVPVVFISGDKGICEAASRFIPEIGAVAVKEGTGKSTTNLHPAVAADRIRLGVAESLAGDTGRCQVQLPGRFQVEVRYKDHFNAYRASFYPGMRQTGDCTVQFETDSYFDVLRMIQFAVG